MASVSDFIVFTLEDRVPVIADQIAQDVAIFTELQNKGRISYKHGGDGFEFRVRKSASGLARPVTDWSAGRAQTVQNYQRLEHDYQPYAAEVMFSRMQLKRNQYADNHAKVANMLHENLNEVYESFSEALGDHMYEDGTATGDDGATAMDGLDLIVDTSSTYIGVDRSSETWWQANTRAVSGNFLDDTNADGVCNGVDAMRLALLDASQGAVSDKNTSKSPPKRKNKPDLIVTTSTSWNNYATSMQPQQQYVGGGVNDSGQEIAFFGIPVRWCTYATADKMRILSTKHLHIRVVGDKLIYLDATDELGMAGQPRANAQSICSQLQMYTTNSRMHSEVTNTD